MQFDVVGNNIGAMVAAVELAKKGHQVRAINPTPFWGSHLAGKVVNDQDFDFGRIIFDFFSYNNVETSLVSSYDANSRNDVGRFYSHIRKYIESLIEINEFSAPLMYLNGVYHKDFLFADSLEILQKLDESKKAKVIAELEQIVNNDNPLHASNKKNPSDEFLNTDFSKVSIANHGKTLHEYLIAPYLKKILSTETPSLNPLYHRIPWVPLYYPETLLSQFSSSPQKIPVPKFHYPKSGKFSVIIDRLKEQLVQHPNIQVYHEDIQRIVKREDNSYSIKLSSVEFETDKIIWASDQEQLIRALGLDLLNEETQKLPITFNLLKIKSDRLIKQFSVLVVVDPDLIPFRVTNQINCSGIESEYSKLVVECNPKLLEQKVGFKEDVQKEEIIDSLIKMKIISSKEDVEDFTLRKVSQTIRIPNRSNELIFNEYDKMIHLHHNEIDRLGTSLNYVSTSINDHIIQGLRMAEIYG